MDGYGSKDLKWTVSESVRSWNPKKDGPKIKDCTIWRNLRIWKKFIGKSRKLFPKNGRWLRGYPGNFLQILQFWGVTQGIFRKLFPGKFNEYLPMKKYFVPKTGHDSEAFPENFSNIWKKFPKILMGHYPNLRNFKFYLNHRFWKKFPVNRLSPESSPIWVKRFNILRCLQNLKWTAHEVKTTVLESLSMINTDFHGCYFALGPWSFRTVHFSFSLYKNLHERRLLQT